MSLNRGRGYNMGLIGKQELCITFWWENLKGREYMRDLSIDVRRVLHEMTGTISWDVTLCSSVEVHTLKECW
jgi:hypothetical protein